MSTVLFIEDNQKQRKYLIQCAVSVNSELEVLGTGFVKEAMAIIGKKVIDIFFIDIQLMDGNGIDLARMIRKLPEHQFTPIIFITGMLTKEMEAFHDIHCYDYIIKPFSRKSILAVMKSMLYDYLNRIHPPVYVDLNYRGLVQKVNADDIIYIEKRNRKIILFTKQEEILYKHMTLREISRVLPEGFIQVHQSFLVNKSLIQKVDLNQNLILCEYSSEPIPIGVSFKKGVVEVVYGAV